MAETVDYLVVGAGVSGLSFANWIREQGAGAEMPSVLVLEAEDEPGGYCRTVTQDGFVWDYSGHFFHFRDPKIEQWLRDRMPNSDIRTVDKRSLIRFGDRYIDFPFQKNIHQLDREDFLDCLVSLYFKDEGREPSAAPTSFKDMLYARLGSGICERFLVPYNEKLYACDLDDLDSDAMGRFFPHANTDDIIRNFTRPDNRSYNSTFTYPRGGAFEYVGALLHDLPDEAVRCGQRVVSVDLKARTATTHDRTIGFRHLVSSVPLPSLAAMSGVGFDTAAFRWNKVCVFNLGFDRKGLTEPHWLYFADKSLAFYRVGFYDNIHDGDRMSLYVEVGAKADADVDMEALRKRCLADLSKVGIVTDHQLLSHHQIILDPAYVHVTQASNRETVRLQALMAEHGVHSVGRYGGWTYCSIEDNMIETRDLAKRLCSGE